MKQYTEGKGFTLIELLVVIAIIAILMAILQPAIFKALANAKKTRVQSELKSIESAIQAYYSEYSKLPVQDTWQGLNPDKVCKNAESMDVISRLVTNNPRKIVFLDVPDGKTDGTFLDPWDTQYAIALDTDYNGITEVTTSKVMAASFTYSAGPDGDYDTTPDNIYTPR